MSEQQAAAGGDNSGSVEVEVDVDEIIDSVAGGIQRGIALAANDPCYAAEESWAHYRDFLDPKINTAWSRISAMSDAGMRSVLLARSQWGRASVQYLGAQRFAARIAEKVVTTGLAALAGGPLGAAIAVDWLDDKLPASGSTRPSSSTAGQHLGGGIYLAAGAGKTLTGPGLGREYDAWRREQSLKVAPARFNTWRESLVSLGGRARSDWTVWRQGDKVAEYQAKAMSGDYDHLLAVSMDYVEFDL